MKSVLLHPLAKPLVFAAALAPLAWMVWAAMNQALGANPAEALIRSLGDWTLRMLCLTLAVTPVRQWTGQPALARLRRMLGLFTAFYGTLHFLAYAWLDMELELQDILRDIAKRPFILVGTAALLLMLPLAATSPRWLSTPPCLPCCWVRACGAGRSGARPPPSSGGPACPGALAAPSPFGRPSITSHSFEQHCRFGDAHPCHGT